MFYTNMSILKEQSSHNSSSPKLYHLSENGNLSGKKLTPRIPDNFMTKNGYEENKTARISFAESIDGALVGISSNLKGKVFFIYEIDEEYIKPEIKRISNKEVPDQSLTGEVWVLNTVKIKQTGKIKVTEAHSKPLKYKYGEIWADTYKWKYVKESITIFI